MTGVGTRGLTGAPAMGTLLLLAGVGFGPLGAQNVPGSEPSPLTLAQVLEAASRGHPSVAALRAVRAGAEASSREAKGARLPWVEARSGVTRFELPMVVAPIHSLDLGGPRPDFDETLIQSRVQGGWILFDGGARSGRIRGTEAAAAGTAAGVDAAVAHLLEVGTAAFLAVETARRVAEANRERVAALEAERARAALFVEEGRSPRVEILRAGAALQEAVAGAASAEAAVRLAERELARLAGMDPREIEGRPLAPLPHRTAGAAVAGGGLGEPSEPAELRRARLGVEAAEAALVLARSAWFPRLAAGAGISQFGGARGNVSFEWDLGVQVEWSLFDGGARREGMERARAELRRAREELRAAELRQAAELDRAEAALTEALARREALEAAVEGFQEVVRIEALALAEGAGVQRDLLAARASLLEAQAGLARAEEAVILARVARARAMGVLTLPWLLEEGASEALDQEPDPAEGAPEETER